MTTKRKPSKRSLPAPTNSLTYYVTGYQAGFDDGLTSAHTVRLASRPLEAGDTDYLRFGDVSAPDLALRGLSDDAMNVPALLSADDLLNQLIGLYDLQPALDIIRSIGNSFSTAQPADIERALLSDTDLGDNIVDLHVNMRGVSANNRREAHRAFFERVSAELPPDAAQHIIVTPLFRD